MRKFSPEKSSKKYSAAYVQVECSRISRSHATDLSEMRAANDYSEKQDNAAAAGRHYNFFFLKVERNGK